VPLETPVSLVVVVACAGTATVSAVTAVGADSVTRRARPPTLRRCSSIVTFGGTEMSGGVTMPAAVIVNAAGMRTSVAGAVGRLCLGARFLGTSGGRELVVDVVVVAAVDVVVVAAVGVLALGVLAAVDELLALDEEWPAPPQAARVREASMAPHSARRSIGAL
jgi:hypothetical protein